MTAGHEQMRAARAARVGQVIRVSWYCQRASLRQSLAGLLAVVALLALLGGLAIASVAAARRTSSSYSSFLASTNPSDLSLGTGLFNPALGYDSGYDAALVSRIADLAGVRRLESYAEINATPLGVDNAPTPAAKNASFGTLGSVDGQFFDQDRATAIRGRRPDPSRADEFAVTAELLPELGLHLGQEVRLGVYTQAQSALPGFGTPAVPPHLAITARLVGVVVFNHAVVQDDVDTANSQDLLLTPALTRRVLSCCSFFAFSSLRLDHGSRDVGRVQDEIRAVFPPGLPFDPKATSLVRIKTQRALQPAAAALGVFGGVVALADIVVVTQVIGRLLRGRAREGEVLRALGAGPSMVGTNALLGILAALAIGSALAGAVAVALSPLAPLGPVRLVNPAAGIDVDWAVVGAGVAALGGVLAALALLLVRAQGPHRSAHGADQMAASPRLIRILSVLPAPMATGIRLGFGRGLRRSAAPMRAAALAAGLAVFVLVGSVTFGSSLSSLVSHPALYGWNWDYALSGGGGVGAVPAGAAARLLGRDHDVAAWSGAYFANFRISGQTVPVLGVDPSAPVGPPVLSGHGLTGSDQIVLGPATLAGLHRRVGDTIEVRYGRGPSTRLRIVGTTALPAIGVGGVDVVHLSMNTGAELSYRLIPASVRNSFGNSPPGPNAILVRTRLGVPPQRAQRSLARIAEALSLPTNFGVSVLDVQRPAEIVNYRSMRDTPAYLAAALGVGAIGALGMALLASVRRCRCELAVLKTLGFSQIQLAGVIAWQSTVAVTVGVLVGTPLGIAAGRQSWDLFAKAVGVVPAPSVPIAAMALIAGLGVALSNLAAALPARLASRVPAAMLLQSE